MCAIRVGGGQSSVEKSYGSEKFSKQIMKKKCIPWNIGGTSEKI
jgi:hypothetical protein